MSLLGGLQFPGLSNWPWWPALGVSEWVVGTMRPPHRCLGPSHPGTSGAIHTSAGGRPKPGLGWLLNQVHSLSGASHIPDPGVGGGEPFFPHSAQVWGRPGPMATSCPLREGGVTEVAPQPPPRMWRQECPLQAAQGTPRTLPDLARATARGPTGFLALCCCAVLTPPADGSQDSG